MHFTLIFGLTLALTAAVGHASAPPPTPSDNKPFVLFAAWPLVGHTTPLVFQAAELARRGIARRIVVANTAFVDGPQKELVQMFTSPEGEAYGLGVEYAHVGFANVTSRRVVPVENFFIKDRDIAATEMIYEGMIANMKALYDGLMEAFGAEGSRPDYVVCDYISWGCNDFAVALGIPVIFNNADVMQTVPWHWFDWTVYLQDGRGSLKTPEDVQKAYALQASPTGTLRRMLQGAGLEVYRQLVRLALANSTEALWPGRPETLPPLFYWATNAHDLILVNSFVPFEAPQLLPSNVVLTGPILSSSLLARGRQWLSGQPINASTLSIDDDLRSWMENDERGLRVVYISLGTVFALPDAPRITALTKGLLRGGARVIWKTHLKTEVTEALRAAGLLEDGATQSRDVFVTKWVRSQLDVLGHPSISVFLSHCGTNSVLEATALGTPVLCLPVGHSQVMTAVQLMRIGSMAAYLDLYGDLEDSAEKGLRLTLEKYDDIVAHNRVLLKHIVLSRGAGRCVDELELVLAHGSTAYRLPPVVPMWARHGMDVHIVGFVVLVGVMVGTLWCCRVCCCCKCGSTRTKAAAKPKAE